MATYNRAHFIKETLRSIQNQTFGNWECLIIDDAGTDNTKEVIADLLNNDGRFHYLKRPDNYKKGLPGCRNYGLDLAKGEYVVFFDDDDFVHPQNLEITLKFIKRLDVDFVHFRKKAYETSLPEIIDYSKDFNFLTNDVVLEDHLTHRVGLASCTILWNRDCFMDVRFNEYLMYAEEWECYTRILLNNKLGKSINAVLYYNFKHSNSNTGEFYKANPIRVQSNVEAIKMVVINLKKNGLLNLKLKKYFIRTSISFKEYNLKDNLIVLYEDNTFNYNLYYFKIRIKSRLYKLKKRLLK